MALFYAAAIRWIFETPPERAGQFGDMFGALNAIFAGLAFVGLLATIAYQHQEIKDARTDAKQLKKSVEKMTFAMIKQVQAVNSQRHSLDAQNNLLDEQNATTREQNANAKRAEYLNALIARIENYDRQIAQISRNQPPPRDLFLEQENLIAELDEILEFTRDREQGSFGMLD
jgi:hypothetical protein